MQTIKSFLLNSRILLVLLVLVLFAGCSDDDKGSTGSSCWSCHDSSNPERLNLSNGYKNKDFINHSAGNSDLSTNCTGIAILNSSNPNESLILIAASSGYNGTSKCRGIYNYHTSHNATLNSAEAADLIEWINKQN